MPPRILVTGFGPFAKTSDNPSAMLAEACGVDNRVLKVSWQAVDEWIESRDGDRYDILIHLGFADRTHITPEVFARNRVGYTPDVDGVDRRGEVEAGAPLLLESSLWTPSFLGDLLMDSRLQASMDAGCYLCNYIAYRSLRVYPKIRTGFLHVPSFEKIPQAEQLEVLTKLVAKLTDEA